MLTFGSDVVDLAVMGDTEWAEVAAWHFEKWGTVTRMRPVLGDPKIADHQPSKLPPRKARYWNQGGNKTLGIGHVFKYSYVVTISYAVPKMINEQ